MIKIKLRCTCIYLHTLNYLNNVITSLMCINNYYEVLIQNKKKSIRATQKV